MQTAVSQMNVAFGEGIGDFDEDAAGGFNPCDGLGLTDALKRVPSLDLGDPVYDFIDTFPSALRAAVQGIIWENFNRTETVPITFAWQPAYDYSITVHDVHDTDATRGGITIVFTSRYPGDEHPLAASRS